MNISCFDDLLTAARYQPLPQRLLLVFADIELPDGSTPEQRADYEAGHGGALTPLMCVDKSPQELDSFASLVAEAASTGQKWGMVFAAALSRPVGQPPSVDGTAAQLQLMVEAIKDGRIGGYLAFDVHGFPVKLLQ